MVLSEATVKSASELLGPHVNIVYVEETSSAHNLANVAVTFSLWFVSILQGTPL